MHGMLLVSCDLLRKTNCRERAPVRVRYVMGRVRLQQLHLQSILPVYQACHYEQHFSLRQYTAEAANDGPNRLYSFVREDTSTAFAMFSHNSAALPIYFPHCSLRSFSTILLSDRAVHQYFVCAASIQNLQSTVWGAHIPSKVLQSFGGHFPSQLQGPIARTPSLDFDCTTLVSKRGNEATNGPSPRMGSPLRTELRP